MKIPCRQHPNSFVERVCASTTCRKDACLCWECMIDEAEHARQHRESMVLISIIQLPLEVFAERLDQEYKNISEKKLREKSKASQEHLQLLENKQQYIDRYRQTIENRKSWSGEIIRQTQQILNEECERLREELEQYYDEKVIEYTKNVEYIVDCIGHRYGLQELPNKDQIIQHLETLSETKKECDSYISLLKKKLQVPEELNRNLSFQDSNRQFQDWNDLISEVNQQLEDLLNEDSEHYYDREPIFQDIIKQVNCQCKILAEEIKVNVITKDPILSKHEQRLEESLNTLPDETKQNTIANQLFESPKLFDTVTPSPFATQNHFMEQLHQKISFVKSINTQQTKGITAILAVDGRQIISASKDKTIRVNNLEIPSQSYTLEGHIDQVTAIALFEKLLVSGAGNMDSSIIVWSLAQRKMIHRLCGHQSGITTIIQISSHCILSGSYDNLAIIWNANAGKSVCALKKHTAMVSSLVQVKRDVVMTGSWDKTVAIWQLTLEGEQIISAAYVRDVKTDGAVLCLKKLNERLIVQGGTSNKINIIDWMNGELKQKISTSQFGICDLLIRDELLIGLGASDSTLRLWRNGNEIEVYRDQKISINNYNTNPKIIALTKKTIAVVNNQDQNAHFDIFSINE